MIPVNQFQFLVNDADNNLFRHYDMVLRNNYVENKFAQEFGINVCSDLVSVPARVRTPPMLKYHDSGWEKTCAPSVGQWNMIGKKMINGGIIDDWECLGLSCMSPDDRFTVDLIQMCNATEMSVTPRLLLDIRSSSPKQIENGKRHYARLFPEVHGKREMTGKIVNILPETVSRSILSTRMIGTSKIQVICRIENFGSTPMQFEDTSTIQQVVSAAFSKQKIQTCDAAIRFNGRNAYFEDRLGYLNINNDKECSIYIRPRLRGGQPPPSCSTAPPELFVKYLSRLGDELFDVVTFPQIPELYFAGMDRYFVSLGLKAIEIAKMLFELLESIHERQECVTHFILANLSYDPTSNKLMFRGDIRIVDFEPNLYFDNMFDAGTIVSQIFQFDEARLRAYYSGIHIPPNTVNNNSKIPKFVQLLIYDLQVGIRVFPGAGTNKRARDYFRCHVALMTPAARLAFWLSSELHFDFLGGEYMMDLYFGVQHIPDWSSFAKQSTAMNTVYCFRSYNDTSLGSQWSCSRNWLSHARTNLGPVISEKQAEAYLNLVYQKLLYNLLVKITFPAAVVNWPAAVPASPLPLPPPSALSVGPTQGPLNVSNTFTLDQLLVTDGSL